VHDCSVSAAVALSEINTTTAAKIFAQISKQTLRTTGLTNAPIILILLEELCKFL